MESSVALVILVVDKELFFHIWKCAIFLGKIVKNGHNSITQIHLNSESKASVILVIHDIEFNGIFFLTFLDAIVETEEKVFDLAIDNGQVDKVSMIWDWLIEVEFVVE